MDGNIIILKDIKIKFYQKKKRKIFKNWFYRKDKQRENFHFKPINW